MTNQNVGIEINGGGRNKISDSNITVKSIGKGVVINNSTDNELVNVNILLEQEKKFFEELEDVVDKIQDNSINQNTNQYFKEQALYKIHSIQQLKNREEFTRNILDLVSWLSSWMSITVLVQPVISPYLSELLKFTVG